MKYFGTDGFRGVANEGLTADHAFKIGKFLGWYFTQGAAKTASCVIGKDTRRSSYMFEYALASGLSSTGVNVYLLHVTTTPSVSYITKYGDFDFGIMITASHNPFYDNGIKVIDRDGYKMSDEILEKIEEYLDGKFVQGDTVEEAYLVGVVVDGHVVALKEAVSVGDAAGVPRAMTQDGSLPPGKTAADGPGPPGGSESHPVAAPHKINIIEIVDPVDAPRVHLDGAGKGGAALSIRIAVQVHRPFGDGVCPGQADRRGGGTAPAGKNGDGNGIVGRVRHPRGVYEGVWEPGRLSSQRHDAAADHRERDPPGGGKRKTPGGHPSGRPGGRQGGDVPADGQAVLDPGRVPVRQPVRPHRRGRGPADGEAAGGDAAPMPEDGRFHPDLTPGNRLRRLRGLPAFRV